MGLRRICLLLFGSALVFVAIAADDVSAQQAPSYLALLDRYRAGDVESAPAELARWSRHAVDDTVKISAALLGDPSNAALVALLHTEAALRGGDRPAHVAAAVAAVAHLGDERYRSFVSNWRSVLASWLLAVNEVDEAYALAGDERPSPEVLLLQGAVAEAKAKSTKRPRRSAFQDIKRSDGNSRVALLQEAETKYLAALSGDRSLGEASVRLASLLIEERDWDRALDILRRCRPELQDPFLVYMAALFLGRLQEQAGHRDEAKACYEEALRLYPEAQTAHLALAQLVESQGHPVDGWHQVEQLFATDPGARRDPWWVFPHAQFWQIDRRLGVLRQETGIGRAR